MASTQGQADNAAYYASQGKKDPFNTPAAPVAAPTIAPQTQVIPEVPVTETLGQKNLRQQAEFAAKTRANNAPVASPGMDTSPENVIGLNKEISTLFGKKGSPAAATPVAPAPATPALPTTLADASQNVAAAAQTAVDTSKTAFEQQAAATKAAQVAQTEGKDAQISAATQLQQEQEAINRQRISDAQAQAAEYAQIKQAATDKQLATTQPLLDKQIAQDQANIDKAQADFDVATDEAKINSDVEMQQNNVAFAKLGLNMSPAAMNTTMQIAQTGMLKLAQLKGQFGLNKATLVNKMAQETVDNQLRINKIIDDNALDVFDFKTKTKDKIASIQSDISLSRKEKADAISKIQTDYHNNMLKLSDKLVVDTRSNNDYVDKQLTKVHDMIKQSQEEGKAKVNESILSGGWSNLSPQQRAELAKDAGLSLREVEGMKTNTTYTAVNAGLAAYIPGQIISPASQKVIYDDANARIATGTPVSLAIQQAILTNAEQLPEFQKYKTEAAQKTRLDTEMKQAEIEAKRASAYAARTGAQVNVGELALKQAESVPRLEILQAQAKAEKSDYTYSTPREDGTVIAFNKNDPTKVKIIEPVLEKTPAQWKATTGIDLVKAPEGEIIPSRLPASSLTNSNGGKECGEFANDLAGRVNVGDSVAERKQVFTDQTPKVGGQVFFTGKGYSSQFGHIAVVTSVSPDGQTMTVKESNLKGDGRVSTRVIPTSDATGFYNNTPLEKKMSENSIDNLEEYTPINSKATRNALKDSLNIDPSIAGPISDEEINSIINKVSKDTGGEPAKTIEKVKSTLADYGYLAPAQYVPRDTTDIGSIIKAFDKYKVDVPLETIKSQFPNFNIKATEDDAKEGDLFISSDGTLKVQSGFWGADKDFLIDGQPYKFDVE